MQPIRVLNIDGDVLGRQLVARVLEGAGMEVAAAAGEADAAREALSHEPLDVVLLDLDRLGMEGLALLHEWRGSRPRLPVIVFCTRSREGGRQAVAALAAGAAEVITKPEGRTNLLFAAHHLEKRLVPAIRAVVAGPHGLERGRHTAAARASSPDGPPVRLVVVGGCTGGPRALFELLPQLPPGLAVPVLIAQHLPRWYTAALAEHLAAIARRPVEEARTGALVQPGQVWVAPGGYHLTVSRVGSGERLEVHRGPRERGCRPSVDALFRSAAHVLGAEVLGVVLSGHGADGLQGCWHVHDAGGQVVVQDPATAVAGALPAAVASAGLADAVLPPAALAREVTRRVQAAFVGEPAGGRSFGPRPGAAP